MDSAGGEPIARVYRGRDEVRGYVEDWLGTFDDVHIELRDPTDLGGRVFADVRASGRGRASGLELDTSFCQVWTLRGGRAVGLEEFATREQALGG